MKMALINKYTHLIRLFLLSFCFLIYHYSIGQQVAKLPGESIYLTVNESILKTNEALWFKANVLTSENVNQTLHVYLLSSDDSVITYKRVQLINNQGFGQIILSDTLPTGYYQLVVFTDRMQAFPNSYVHTDITVINSKKGQLTRPFEKRQKEVQLTFFPEGGNLIANHPTIVGIQLSGTLEMDSNTLEVFIDNSAGETITQCQLNEKGISFFSIKPLQGERYTARLKINQKEYKEPLPTAKERGYGLTALNRPAAKMVKIINSQTNDTVIPCKVLISQSGKIFSEFSTPKQPVFSVNIPYDSIPHRGIISIDVFDNKGEHIAYRKVFIPKENTSVISFSSLPKMVKTGEKVEVKFQVKKANQAISGSSLSVCVVDSSRSFFSFSGKDSLSIPQMDINLLTAAPLDWDSINTLKEGGYVLKGVLKSKQKAKTLPTVSLLSHLNGMSIIEISQTDSTGHFEFRPLPLMDTTQLFLTIKDKNPSNWQMELMDDVFLNRPHYSIPQKSLSASRHFVELKKFVDDHLKTNQLEEVIITAKKEDPVQKRLRMNFLQEVGVGLEAPEISFDINESDPKITLFDILKKKYPGIHQSSVFIVNNLITGGSTTVSTNQYCLSFGKDPCKLILNGKLILNECAQDMQANRIKNVEFYRISVVPSYPPVPFLSITTKDAGNYDYKKDKPNTGNFVKRGFGYSTPLSFESLQAIENSDYRSTIYWNPNVITDEKGEASFVFNSAKAATTYFVKIEGSLDNGQIISTVQRITVKE